jgi:hypothetical protein
MPVDMNADRFSVGKCDRHYTPALPEQMFASSSPRIAFTLIPTRPESDLVEDFIVLSQRCPARVMKGINHMKRQQECEMGELNFKRLVSRRQM